LRPTLPRHYRHIRIAMLAYYGNPQGAFEDNLLRNSVDLVVPSPSYLKHFHDVAPKVPLLHYTNTSTLYLDLLTDWLTFADRKGTSREVAFYHAAMPVPFKGNSPSSQPVTWFWRVARGGGNYFADVTAAARGPRSQVPFARAGESLFLGYPDPFREINCTLALPGLGCSIVPEYCAAVDGAGKPASWQPLRFGSDGTGGFRQSGRIAFDPPAGWKAASVGGSARLYFVRLRTVAAQRPPVAASLLGRDFVGANGSTSGTIPSFDARADANGDGYLDDTEYARRAPGKDARFLYESRMVSPWYGQMRFLTCPAHPTFREWAGDYHKRLLARQPLAAGLFLDNSGGRMHHRPEHVVEASDNYSGEYAQLVAVLEKAVAPRWILLNTEGGKTFADPVIRENPAYLEEFAIKPLAHTVEAFEELLETVERRSRLTTPPPLAVIDSHPENGSPTDPRTQMATLAAYYLMADPDTTCLMFYGGFEPGTSWQRHWVPAAAYDVGRPTARWTRLATGLDPANPRLAYRVYARSYEKALVLYRPLSSGGPRGGKGPLGNESATRHELGATYRPLQADGSLGAPLTNIVLRNGEGAVLIRTNP
jgi:hypothetical protein